MICTGIDVNDDQQQYGEVIYILDYWGISDLDNTNQQLNTADMKYLDW